MALVSATKLTTGAARQNSTFESRTGSGLLLHAQHRSDQVHAPPMQRRLPPSRSSKGQKRVRTVVAERLRPRANDRRHRHAAVVLDSLPARRQAQHGRR